MRAEAVTFPLHYIYSNQACQAAGNLNHALHQNRSSTRIILLISQFLIKENDGSEEKVGRRSENVTTIACQHIFSPGAINIQECYLIVE